MNSAQRRKQRRVQAGKKEEFKKELAASKERKNPKKETQNGVTQR